MYWCIKIIGSSFLLRFRILLPLTKMSQKFYSHLYTKYQFSFIFLSFCHSPVSCLPYFSFLRSQQTPVPAPLLPHQFPARNKNLCVVPWNDLGLHFPRYPLDLVNWHGPREDFAVQWRRLVFGRDCLQFTICLT